MAINKEIRGKVDDAKHEGRRSAIRGLQATAAALREFLSGDSGETHCDHQKIVLAQSPEKSMSKY